MARALDVATEGNFNRLAIGGRAVDLDGSGHGVVDVEQGAEVRMSRVVEGAPGSAYEITLRPVDVGYKVTATQGKHPVSSTIPPELFRDAGDLYFKVEEKG